MIKLQKLEKPEILNGKFNEWTDAYIKALSSDSMTDTIKFRYRAKEIKQQLLDETYHKCAYCESKIGHVIPGDVEHIKPSSKHPQLHFEWNNLTIACPECNRRKKDYDDDELPFINPYNDEIKDMVYARGPMIFYNLDNVRAEISVCRLELNGRLDLLERRTERLKSIYSLIKTWNNEQNPKVKDFLKGELLKECESDKEYSLCVKSLVFDSITQSSNSPINI